MIFLIILLFCFAINLEAKEADIVISASKKIYNDKGKYWDLIGKPKLQNGNDIIKANTIKYFAHKKNARGKGNVQLFDYEKSIEIFGDEFEYFTNSRNIKLAGNTKLFAIKDNFTVSSKFLNRIEKKKYVARESVEIQSEVSDTFAKAGVATYEIEIKKLTLEQNPVVTEQESTYSADKITFFTDTKEFILEGNGLIRQANRKITADFIHYYSNAKDKKAILKGTPQIIELSNKNSLLKGRPYRIIKAGKITYHNTSNPKALLEDSPVVNEYFLEKDDESKNNMSRFLLHKRIVKANVITYFAGNRENKYTLIGNAQVNDSKRAAFADRIDYKDGDNAVALLKGNAIFYIFNDSYNGIKNKVKTKGNAKSITYYPDTNIIVLKQDASLLNSDKESIKANYIYYNTDNNTGYAKNNISFRKKDKIGRADLARFVSKDKIILKGRAVYKGKDFEASADYISYDDVNQEAILNKNAIILDKDTKASGESINYKKSGQTKAITITGKGNITGRNIKGKGDKIFYKSEGDKELLNLFKKASILRDNDLAFAEEIIYYNVPLGKDKQDERILLKKNVRLIGAKREIHGDAIDIYSFEDNPEYKEKVIAKGNGHIINKDDYKQSFADRIEYIKNTKDKEEIILVGNTELLDEKMTGYADRIVILPNDMNSKKDKYTLTGKPFIQLKDSVIAGNLIEILDGEDNIINIIGDGKYINHEENIDLFADSINYSVNNEVVKANGNAVFKERDEELTFFADSITRYEKQKNSVALNKIKVVQKKKNIYGNQATYDEEKKELVVTNETYIVEGNNFVGGNKIILDTDARSVLVLGRRKGQVRTSK